MVAIRKKQELCILSFVFLCSSGKTESIKVLRKLSRVVFLSMESSVAVPDCSAALPHRCIRRRGKGISPLSRKTSGQGGGRMKGREAEEWRVTRWVSGKGDEEDSGGAAWQPWWTHVVRSGLHSPDAPCGLEWQCQEDASTLCDQTKWNIPREILRTESKQAKKKKKKFSSKRGSDRVQGVWRYNVKRFPSHDVINRLHLLSNHDW